MRINRRDTWMYPSADFCSIGKMMETSPFICALKQMLLETLFDVRSEIVIKSIDALPAKFIILVCLSFLPSLSRYFSTHQMSRIRLFLLPRYNVWTLAAIRHA